MCPPHPAGRYNAFMRLVAPLLLAFVPLLALAACGDDKKAGPAASPSDTASAAASVAASQSASAQPTPSASPSASATSAPMPPRPVPIGSSGPIQPGAPAEQQMMAIVYTLAMVQPRGNDPLTVDKTYFDEIVKKLEGAVRTADKGKTPPNPVKGNRGNRKIEVEMGKGCTDRVPSSLIQGAGSSLKAAYEAGVLVISCHDAKWECHQSTRDPKDVLCHAAPRH
jgi:hypothetical protein